MCLKNTSPSSNILSSKHYRLLTGFSLTFKNLLPSPPHTPICSPKLSKYFMKRYKCFCATLKFPDCYANPTQLLKFLDFFFPTENSFEWEKQILSLKSESKYFSSQKIASNYLPISEQLSPFWNSNCLVLIAFIDL